MWGVPTYPESWNNPLPPFFDSKNFAKVRDSERKPKDRVDLFDLETL